MRRRTADHTQDSIFLINCRKFGQRKSWHLVGLLYTLVSFPFIFIFSPITPNTIYYFYYAVFATVHCFGWASQQVIDQATLDTT